MRNIKHLIFIYLVFINMQFVIGQSKYTPHYGDPLKFSWNWTLFPEISGIEMRCIEGDDKSTLWIGGNGTVIQYDGLHWKRFTRSAGLPQTHIQVLKYIDENNIYAGTSNGLFRLRGEKWENVLPHDTLFSINIQSIRSFNNAVWAATNRGIFRIDINGITLITSAQIASQLPDSFKRIHQQIIPSKLGDNFFISDIYGLKNGWVFLTRLPGEIIRYNPNLKDDDPDNWVILNKINRLESGLFQKIMEDDNGKIWFISEEANAGINIYNPSLETWTSFKLNEYVASDDIHVSIIQTYDGTIWIGGHGKLYLYKNGIWKVYDNNLTPIPDARIVLARSKDGSVWVGGRNNDLYRIDYLGNHYKTYIGLNYYVESPFKTYWFISSENEVVYVKEETNEWRRYNKNDGLIDAPLVLFADRDSTIWAAGSDRHQAAFSYLDSEKRWITYRFPNFSWAIHYQSVFQASDGTIWMGSYSSSKPEHTGGILRIRKTPGGLETTILSAQETGKLHVVGIAESPAGTLWTGGTFISRFDGNMWQQVDMPKEFASEWFDDVRNTLNGALWLAKEGVGLYYRPVGTENWQKYTVTHGLASNTVLSILPLNEDILLAGTPKGISLFDGSGWIRHVLPKQVVIKRESGVLRSSSDGKIWVNFSSWDWNRRASTSDSKNLHKKFDEIMILCYKTDNLGPDTWITQAQDTVSEDGNILISWNASDYLKVTPEEELQYSYRLDNRTWSSFLYSNQITLLSLPSGHHTIEVKARDWDLNIDTTPAVKTFYVRFPLWKRPWFILLMVMLLSTILILLIYLYRKHVVIRNMEAMRVHELDMMKLRFYTNITHDLRTPLHLILDPLEDILEKGPRVQWEMINKRIKMIRRNAQRLLHLVNEIIDFRKIETGALIYSPSSGHIIKYLNTIYQSFISLAQEREIDYRFNAPKEDIYVLFDADKLDKILFNILSNAFKYTPYRGQIIFSTHLNKRGGRNILTVSIEDSGPGIPPKHLNDIFDRFIQLDSRTYGKNKGAGIGLAFTKELVDICDGEIIAENKPQGGAIFTVRLPLERSDENLRAVIQKETLEAIGNDWLTNGNKEHQSVDQKDKPIILIIEDDDDEREYLHDKLCTDFNIIEAEDGKKGLEKALHTIPDIIVSDVMMPEMDGIELCKSLKQNQLTSHIPVILLTGSSSEEREMQGFKTGAH